MTKPELYWPDAEETRAAEALAAGIHPDPFSFLGPHRTTRGAVVRAFLPGATGVEIRAGDSTSGLVPVGNTGLFVGTLKAGPLPSSYRLRIRWGDVFQETEDPYAFGPILGDLDLHLFSEGAHWNLAERLGAAVTHIEGVEGVRFAVWAPNARRVSVVGDFNSWDGRRHLMRLRHSAGVWEMFIPRLAAGERYKYEIIGPDGRLLPLKADPLARLTERPPANGSIVAQPWRFHWSDADWMAARGNAQSSAAPIAIYEVHAASWLRPPGDADGILDWRALAERLIPYVTGLGFTHVELMPIMEHPFGGSWGYQPLSQFAPSARYGAPEEFAHFVDACHRAGVGIILDWVPAHFPSDAHGLAQFDGTALYEHSDPREGVHRDWNTLIYNLGRREVQGFLIASALYWLEHFHVDGLRVDAVASMLYRDYSRQPGDWIPNRYGGRENLEAVDFLRRLNTVVGERCPGALTIAEESTAWPGVSAPVSDGGLGFSFKWNMGWMHDTLSYIARDPIHRSWHHNDFTFGLIYAFSERFILPLSHDEVVHGKRSLYGRVPGDAWQKLATLRAYFGFMWTHPGKKLLFMGGEIGQGREWSHDGEIDWDALRDPGHAGLQRLVGDLNRLYTNSPALYASDANPEGFRWLVGDDSANSVFAYERRAAGANPIVIVVNMTPTPRHDYRIGVSHAGQWREIINTDAALYGGSNLGNAGRVATSWVSAHGHEHSLNLVLPPLATVVLAFEG
ncbi:MAG TPA: 1,4-alpha-glucan branching protein GlgB [Micropepsaceae bacterium]|jgi:1,4-alpha-glucan branching enzyme|nr:1,4-alpha-glucan branching protein GlgB [Micropepsaceae bacterium]